MPTTLERVTGRLYRVGLRHQRGESSFLSLATAPTRMVVGELAASVADTVTSRVRTRLGGNDRPGRSVGPSTA